MKWIHFFLLPILTFVSSIASAQLPNGELSFSYRQLQDGELSSSVHQVKLICNKSFCMMQTLTLNQCIFGAFYPKIQTSFTGGSSLSISSQGNIISINQIIDGATFNFRISYREGTGLEVVELSGAVIKESNILGKVISWEIYPLKGDEREVKLDCPAYLDGPRN